MQPLSLPFLVAFALLLRLSYQIDCEGKAFYCTDPTHFLICVELENGISSTVDDIKIPCPHGTECRAKNKYECELHNTLSTTPDPMVILGVHGLRENGNTNSSQTEVIGISKDLSTTHGLYVSQESASNSPSSILRPNNKGSPSQSSIPQVTNVNLPYYYETTETGLENTLITTSEYGQTENVPGLNMPLESIETKTMPPSIQVNDNAEDFLTTQSFHTSVVSETEIPLIGNTLQNSRLGLSGLSHDARKPFTNIKNTTANILKYSPLGNETVSENNDVIISTSTPMTSVNTNMDTTTDNTYYTSPIEIDISKNNNIQLENVLTQTTIISAFKDSTTKFVKSSTANSYSFIDTTTPYTVIGIRTGTTIDENTVTTQAYEEIPSSNKTIKNLAEGLLSTNIPSTTERQSNSEANAQSIIKSEEENTNKRESTFYTKETTTRRDVNLREPGVNPILDSSTLNDNITIGSVPYENNRSNISAENHGSEHKQITPSAFLDTSTESSIYENTITTQAYGELPTSVLILNDTTKGIFNTIEITTQNLQSNLEDYTESTTQMEATTTSTNKTTHESSVSDIVTPIFNSSINTLNDNQTIGSVLYENNRSNILVENHGSEYEQVTPSAFLQIITDATVDENTVTTQAYEEIPSSNKSIKNLAEGLLTTNIPSTTERQSYSEANAQSIIKSEEKNTNIRESTFYTKETTTRSDGNLREPGVAPIVDSSTLNDNITISSVPYENNRSNISAENHGSEHKQITPSAFLDTSTESSIYENTITTQAYGELPTSVLILNDTTKGIFNTIEIITQNLQYNLEDYTESTTQMEATTTSTNKTTHESSVSGIVTPILNSSINTLNDNQIIGSVLYENNRSNTLVENHGSEYEQVTPSAFLQIKTDATVDENTVTTQAYEEIHSSNKTIKNLAEGLLTTNIPSTTKRQSNSEANAQSFIKSEEENTNIRESTFYTKETTTTSDVNLREPGVNPILDSSTLNDNITISSVPYENNRSNISAENHGSEHKQITPSAFLDTSTESSIYENTITTQAYGELPTSVLILNDTTKGIFNTIEITTQNLQSNLEDYTESTTQMEATTTSTNKTTHESSVSDIVTPIFNSSINTLNDNQTIGSVLYENNKSNILVENHGSEYEQMTPSAFLQITTDATVDENTFTSQASEEKTSSNITIKNLAEGLLTTNIPSTTERQSNSEANSQRIIQSEEKNTNILKSTSYTIETTTISGENLGEPAMTLMFDPSINAMNDNQAIGPIPNDNIRSTISEDNNGFEHSQMTPSAFLQIRTEATIDENTITTQAYGETPSSINTINKFAESLLTTNVPSTTERHSNSEANAQRIIQSEEKNTNILESTSYTTETTTTSRENLGEPAMTPMFDPSLNVMNDNQIIGSIPNYNIRSNISEEKNGFEQSQMTPSAFLQITTDFGINENTFTTQADGEKPTSIKTMNNLAEGFITTNLQSTTERQSNSEANARSIIQSEEKSSDIPGSTPYIIMTTTISGENLGEPGMTPILNSSINNLNDNQTISSVQYENNRSNILVENHGPEHKQTTPSAFLQTSTESFVKFEGSTQHEEPKFSNVQSTTQHSLDMEEQTLKPQYSASNNDVGLISIPQLITGNHDFVNTAGPQNSGFGFSFDENDQQLITVNNLYQQRSIHPTQAFLHQPTISSRTNNMQDTMSLSTYFISSTAASINVRNHQSASTFNCVNREKGRYSHETDCRKYYVCIGRSKPIVGLCPLDTAFNIYRKQCSKNTTSCATEFQCAKQGRFIDIFDRETYYICMKNGKQLIRYKLRCQKGYRLNQSTSHCTVDTIPRKIPEKSSDISNLSSADKINIKINRPNTKAIDKENKKELTSIEEDLECEKEGKFPIPKNCQRYYICKRKGREDFQIRLRRCDSDEVFHKEKRKCVDIESYECSTD